MEEFDSLNRARQTLFVRKFDEALRLSFRLFRYRNLCFILDPAFLLRVAERSSFGSSLKPKERKKLLSDCRDVRTLSQPRVHSLLSFFKTKGLLECVMGSSIDGHRFHYISDPSHFQHCLGLSDAIDLSMTNTEINVRFRSRFRETEKPSTFWGARRYFSSETKKAKTSQWRHSTKHRRFHLLLFYLRTIPKGRAEKDYVKLIKTSLSKEFSKQMGQELPEGDTFPLFPKFTQAKLDAVFRFSERTKVRFYFNLLQSKALCKAVGEDMIEEAYEKHRENLCRDPEELLVVPEEHLQGLFEYGKRVGQRVEQLYNPEKTKLPNTRASFEKGRHLGGNLQHLINGKRCQVFNNHPLTHLGVDDVRLEPYVVGLFGPPGSGKTTLVQTLIRYIGAQLFNGLPRSDLVYSRSCSVEHWDGYTGQPIVVLDDFGQNHNSRTDIVEFESLVSVNDYILPMADLPDKGQKFISPIIILTSNCKYGSTLSANNQTFVEEPWAVWRRISLPIFVNGSDRYEYDFTHSDQQHIDWQIKHSSTNFERRSACSPWSKPALEVRRTDRLPMKRMNSSPAELSYRILNEIEEKFSHHRRQIQDIWTQKVAKRRIQCHPSPVEALQWDINVDDIDLPSAKNDWSCEMQFPASPPTSPPRVKAIALSEPLKVRMITAAEADTKCLQPFQQALFGYLSEQPQFCLTDGMKTPWSEHETFEDDTLPWIYRMQTMVREVLDRSDPDDLWLSGDYTSATDNFPMSATNALIEGILSEISHKPTRDWVRWEVSQHDILYPKGRVGKQTSGQLMGSLISFPLLCFLNDYIVSTAGFDKKKYLINGDDVAARGSSQCIDRWRALAPTVGLSLSLGKNFIHPRFVTINSQLFYDGDVLHTGKVSCQSRVGASLGYCFEETQFYWGGEDWVKYEFLKRNLLELRKTPRSLHVSKKRGGLGLIDSLDTGIRYDHGLLKEVYLYDLLKAFDSSQLIPGTNIRAVPVPVLRGSYVREHERLVGQDLMNRIREFMPSSGSDSQDLSNRDLDCFRKKVREHFPQETADRIRSITSQGKYQLSKFPTLDFLDIDYIFVQSGKSRFVLERARQHALNLFERVYNDPDLPPITWEGGALSELPGIDREWDLVKEVFLDRNLLMDKPSDLSDLDLTEDLNEYFSKVEQDVDLRGTGVYAPLPTDITSYIDFLKVFGYEQQDETNSSLPAADHVVNEPRIRVC